MDRESSPAVTSPASNPDPLTGAPGSHPVGTGVGALVGGTAGAAAGALTGPVGAAVGAIAGAVLGGCSGKAAAEVIDPTTEEAFWRRHHRSPADALAEWSYTNYAPAYRLGYLGYRAEETFEQREAELRREYEHAVQSGEEAWTSQPLPWEQARAAARAAYQRLAGRGSRTR